MINKVAFVGNYLPRRCGIATFTSDLSKSLKEVYPDLNNLVIPVNDKKEGYDYPPVVRFEIDEKDRASYKCAADFINLSNIDVVCLQHEFGIFGGERGGYILNLLKNINVPVVTTFHTILENPDAKERYIMNEIAKISVRSIVMSEKGRLFLEEIYKIPPGKIDFIHHGIPDVPFIDSNYYKDKFGIEGKKVLLTFGLLSRNKGIEFAIKALPRIIEKHPEVVYMVVGATHPNVIDYEGESYRDSLVRLVEELGVSGHVIFHNRFVSPEELTEFICSAEIYLTPYLNEHQITSGTLSYALGAGRAVISTPYWHAKELLKGGRGRFVPFKDSDAIADEVINFLDNEIKMNTVRKKAYKFGRDMIWTEVVKKYMESFISARIDFSANRNPEKIVLAGRKKGELPAVNLAHLLRMTDNTGILQHAKYTIPDYKEGYTTDDNARALITMVLLDESGKDNIHHSYNLSIRYLAFLNYAFNKSTGRFRNFMSFERKWLEKEGSEDSHGRSLWALGILLGRSGDLELIQLAARLFEDALPVVKDFTSPRAWAYAVIGINEYLRKYSGDRVAKKMRLELTHRLLTLFEKNSSDDWVWFENSLTYDNAKLSHALIMSGQWIGDEKMTEAGLKTLKWLADMQTSPKGNFLPVGNNGFYVKGKMRATFDQQPLEAQAMVSASLEAYSVTNDAFWYKEAMDAFQWFLGRNDQNLLLYDERTGGCNDGLHPDRVNENQGAESTLAFLMSMLEIRTAHDKFAAREDETLKGILRDENILSLKANE